MLDDNMLRTLLGKAQSIAIIGAKDKPGQAVDRVGRYLIDQGYRVFPVHPVRKAVWGLPAVACLADLPEPVDIVNLFRAPEYCPAHAEEVLQLAWKPLLFWMQLGIRSEKARQALAATDIAVMEDACIMVEHKRLFSHSFTAQGQGF